MRAEIEGAPFVTLRAARAATRHLSRLFEADAHAGARASRPPLAKNRGALEADPIPSFPLLT